LTLWKNDPSQTLTENLAIKPIQLLDQYENDFTAEVFSIEHREKAIKEFREELELHTEKVLSTIKGVIESQEKLAKLADK
jgi:hypothetical protein